jgi:hypothetical protein
MSTGKVSPMKFFYSEMMSPPAFVFRRRLVFEAQAASASAAVFTGAGLEGARLAFPLITRPAPTAAHRRKIRSKAVAAGA